MGSKVKVFVGLSGGVDSSVTSALLVEQGYDVTGVYMKNWSKDLPGFPCPWKEDYQDAKRVAVKLGIPFLMFDFEKEYFDKVVGYMLDGFKSGITPNPDIMCNQEIKFKLFYDLSRAKGADFIATGHYANVQHQTEETLNKQTARGLASSNRCGGLIGGQLLTAVDDNKDQTYFLYRVTSEVLEHTLFPLGNLTKPQVRAEAKKRNLVTANKKESMGICFVGKVGIKEFLTTYLLEDGSLADKYLSNGAIIDQDGQRIGKHDGAIFYTIGQRHGLDVGGGLPYYVIGKNMDKNEVYVTNDIQDENLWSDRMKLTSLHWINQPPKTNETYQIRTRHRAKLAECSFSTINTEFAHVSLEEPMRALTPGQSAVFYDGDICIGGGVIA